MSVMDIMVIMTWFVYTHEMLRNQNDFCIILIEGVMKIGSLCFYAIFWAKTKLLDYQWQLTAKTAKNFDPFYEKAFG